MRTRVMFYSALALLLMGMLSPKFHDIEKSLKPYFDAVEKVSEGNLKGITRAGMWKTLDGDTARCYYNFSEVVVSEEYWNRATVRSKFLTIAHEVAHCTLGCKHNEEKLEDGCPASFMYPSTMSANCRIKHLRRYVKEMKTINCGE